MYLLRLLLTFTFAFYLISPINVYAHPGKTDSEGGHYNRSTGEYHYHHGYPEHDHYDMDGDGDLDCPYDFDDKTGSSSNSNNSSSTTPIKPTVKEETQPQETTQPEKSEKEPQKPGQSSKLRVFLEVLMVIIFWYVVVPTVYWIIGAILRKICKN